MLDDVNPSFRFQTVLFDVDGTLVDSNGAHADSWAQALVEHGINVTAADVRPLVGMGGDKVLPALADIESSSERGKKISERKKAPAAMMEWVKRADE